MRSTARPEYEVWRMMRRRCSDASRPDYPVYGGRGIRVSAEWQRSFEAFLRDVGPRPSAKHQLDRIDPDGDYAAGNVRWVTTHTQSRNKRVTRLITANGETLCMTDWAARLGLDASAIHYRIARGWSEVEAVTIAKGGAR